MKIRTHVGVAAMVAVVLLVVGTASAEAQTFKVATWNVQSAKGIDDLDGNDPTLTRNDVCEENAWGGPLGQPGNGLVPQELRQAIRDDPSVVALVLNEAWNCGKPAQIKLVLNETGAAWKTAKVPGTGSFERDGVAILARYGFPPGTDTVTLTPVSTSGVKHILRIPVCLDNTTGCPNRLEVFATHWNGSDGAGQAQRSLDFMKSLRDAGTPHVMLGDLNQISDVYPNCGTATPSTLDGFRTDYVDAWRTLHSEAGYTGMLNDADCLATNGGPYKRIDYSWAYHLTAVTATLFGLPAPGGDAASDHVGFIAEYNLNCTDTTQPTVTITAPANGATVSGPVSVSITANDDVGVASVDLKLDGTTIKTWPAPPYTMSWDTMTVSNGPHTLQAVAHDACTTGQATISVNVQNASNWTLSESFTGTGAMGPPWTVGQWSGSTVDPNIQSRRTADQLEIGPLPNSSGTHYNGIWAYAPGDFTGASAYVEIARAAAGSQTFTMLTIGFDLANYYRVYANNGSLVCIKSIGGTKSDLGPPIAYDPNQPVFVRISHVAGQVACQTAPDNGGIPGTWVDLYQPRQTWNSTNVPLNQVRFELKAGTSAATAGAGSALFDNFKAAKP